MKSRLTFLSFLPSIFVAALALVFAIVGGIGIAYQNSQRNSYENLNTELTRSNRQMDEQIKELNVQCNQLRNPAILRQKSDSMALKDIAYDQILRVKVSHVPAGTRSRADANRSSREDAIELSKTMSAYMNSPAIR